MDYVPFVFRTVCVIFTVSAIATGTQAVIDPVVFSRQFGLPLKDLANKEANYEQQVLRSYVSLMGIRQLGTGLVLTAFMLGRKWNEAATVLSVIGIVVAGTDGFYLSQHASLSKGLFHAIPGALIAALATVYITMHE